MTAWNYLCIIRDPNGNPIPIGKTYNTSIGRVAGKEPLKPGDILKVEFVNLNRYTTKAKKVFYNWWSPRPIVFRPDKKKPDNTITADKLVIASKGTDDERSWPKRYLELTGDAVEEQYIPWLKAPDEDKKWKGMMQFDSRGRSIHIDFRYQTDKDHLFTWTSFIPKGLSKVPESATEAKRMMTSEILPLVRKTMKDPMKKFNCKPEKRIEATADVFEQGLLGGGPGKIQPRWMWNFDSFDIEFGAIKDYYIELFAHGEIADRKIVFRKLENRKEWKKTPEGLMTWMMFATKEQTPYTITRRAVKKEYIPEFGRSALPREIRKKIPSEFQYWKVKDKEARRKKRDELVAAIKKKEVKLDEIVLPGFSNLTIVTDIKDIEKYNPGNATDKQLSDDMRIVYGWYATFHDPKKKIKFTEEQIIETCVKVIKEINRRVKAGTMKYKFSPEKMKPLSRELYEKSMRKLKKKTKTNDVKLGTTANKFRFQQRTWRRNLKKSK